MGRSRTIKQNKGLDPRIQQARSAQESRVSHVPDFVFVQHINWSDPRALVMFCLLVNASVINSVRAEPAMEKPEQMNHPSENDICDIHFNSTAVVDHSHVAQSGGLVYLGDGNLPVVLAGMTNLPTNKASNGHANKPPKKYRPAEQSKVSARYDQLNEFDQRFYNQLKAAIEKVDISESLSAFRQALMNYPVLRREEMFFDFLLDNPSLIQKFIAVYSSGFPNIARLGNEMGLVFNKRLSVAISNNRVLELEQLMLFREDSEGLLTEKIFVDKDEYQSFDWTNLDRKAKLSDKAMMGVLRNICTVDGSAAKWFLSRIRLSSRHEMNHLLQIINQFNKLSFIPERHFYYHSWINLLRMALDTYYSDFIREIAQARDHQALQNFLSFVSGMNAEEDIPRSLSDEIVRLVLKNDDIKSLTVLLEHVMTSDFPDPHDISFVRDFLARTEKDTPVFRLLFSKRLTAVRKALLFYEMQMPEKDRFISSDPEILKLCEGSIFKDVYRQFDEAIDTGNLDFINEYSTVSKEMDGFPGDIIFNYLLDRPHLISKIIQILLETMRSDEPYRYRYTNHRFAEGLAKKYNAKLKVAIEGAQTSVIKKLLAFKEQSNVDQDMVRAQPFNWEEIDYHITLDEDSMAMLLDDIGKKNIYAADWFFSHIVFCSEDEVSTYVKWIESKCAFVQCDDFYKCLSDKYNEIIRHTVELVTQAVKEQDYDAVSFHMQYLKDSMPRAYLILREPEKHELFEKSFITNLLNLCAQLNDIKMAKILFQHGVQPKLSGISFSKSKSTLTIALENKHFDFAWMLVDEYRAQGLSMNEKDAFSLFEFIVESYKRAQSGKFSDAAGLIFFSATYNAKRQFVSSMILSLLPVLAIILRAVYPTIQDKIHTIQQGRFIKKCLDKINRGTVSEKLSTFISNIDLPCIDPISHELPFPNAVVLSDGQTYHLTADTLSILAGISPVSKERFVQRDIRPNINLMLYIKETVKQKISEEATISEDEKDQLTQEVDKLTSNYPKVSDISDCFKDPNTHAIMTRPCIAPNGISYQVDGAGTETHFNTTISGLGKVLVFRNYALQSLIDQYKSEKRDEEAPAPSSFPVTL